MTRAVVLLAALALHPTHLDCTQQPAACTTALAWGAKRRRHDAARIKKLRARVRRLERAAQRRPVTARKAYLPHRAQLLCIHHYEGAWNANTGNGYYGGLQFDASFEQTYGPAYVRRWGHASNWPPLHQMLAAERAIPTRGYTPWPNTARLCGLLP